jgi:hypothetical protein
MLSLDRSEGNPTALVMLYCDYVASDEALPPPPVKSDEDHCNCPGENFAPVSRCTKGHAVEDTCSLSQNLKMFLGFCVDLHISHLTVHRMHWSPAHADECVYDNLDQGAEIPSFNKTLSIRPASFCLCTGKF